LLPKLHFPDYALRLRRIEERNEIFCPLRKKWFVLTPEEWVRQHVVQWLSQEKKYPLSLIAAEKTITVNQRTKRCDLIVYDLNGKPFLLVECKAPEVAITEAVFDQAARYNLTLNADLFLLTNGFNHYCCKMDYEKQQYVFLKELPEKK
jgi:type I site-specific restriction endonuclease